MARLVWLVSIAVLALSFAPQSAPAQSDRPLSRAEFYAAKAAAAGVLDEALLKQAEAITKQNLHAVQLALERWGVDHTDPPDAAAADGYSVYPQHVNQLILDQYAAAGFCANPYTSAADSELNTREVPLGWTPQAAGNFSYIQFYDTRGRVMGYMLVGYGADEHGGLDLDGDGQGDGMVIWLASAWGPAGLPPIEFSGLILSGGRTVQIQPDALPDTVRAKAE